MYKEHYEVIDQNEVDKRIAETLESSRPSEGEEPLTDNERVMIKMRSKL